MMLAMAALPGVESAPGRLADRTITAGPNAPADPARAEVEQAAELIRRHRPADAVVLLDVVLAAEARAHAGEMRRIYCSRSPTETLIYLTLGVKEKRDAVALDSTWSDAFFTRAFALVDLGRGDEAEAMLQRAVELAPMNAHYLGELGELYKSRKDWARAEQRFDAAASAAAFSPAALKSAEQRRAWRGQAYVLTERGKLDEAEALYRKCLALDGGDATARHELDYIAGLRRQAAKTTS